MSDIIERLLASRAVWENARARPSDLELEAAEEIKALSLRLDATEKDLATLRETAWGDKALRIEAERRLDSIRAALETYRHDLVLSEPEAFRRLTEAINGPLVEKHERICGVPDPDDECEECIRPLGHDGEHDFSTPPE